jgi:hypothetical protein
MRDKTGGNHREFHIKRRNICAHLVCWLDVEDFFSLTFPSGLILLAVISDNKRKYVFGENRQKKKPEEREEEIPIDNNKK